MTKEELQKTKAAWVGMYAFYGRDLTDEQLVLQVNSLRELSFDDVMTALKRYKNNLKNARPPIPAQIVELIHPQAEVDDLARDASARIIGAVSKYGWPNPKEAEEYIGSLGWEVVRRVGGWTTVCEMVSPSNVTGLQAQWRDLSATILKLGDIQERRVEIEGPKTKQGAIGFSALIGGIKDGIQRLTPNSGKPVRTDEG